MTDERLTLAFVKGMLMEHEEYLVRENADTSMKALHFRATNTNEKCKKKDKFSPRNKPTFKNKQTQKCYHCGRKNHIKRDCYFYKQSVKVQEKYKKKNNQEVSASTAVIKESFAFMMCNENLNHDDDGSGSFVLDSGATEHIINDLGLFTEYKQLAEPICITVAKKGATIEATHIGRIVCNTTLGYSGELQDVLYSKSVPANLISVRRIQEAGMSVVFMETGNVEIKRGNTTMIKGKRINNLYIIKLIIQNAFNTARAAGHVAAVTIIDKNKLWHERLDHISKNKFSKIQKCELVSDNIYLKDINPINALCEACISGKQTRLPFAKIKDIYKDHY